MVFLCSLFPSADREWQLVFQLNEKTSQLHQMVDSAITTCKRFDLTLTHMLYTLAPDYTISVVQSLTQVNTPVLVEGYGWAISSASKSPKMFDFIANSDGYILHLVLFWLRDKPEEW